MTMKNIISISVEFYFKGKKYSPSIELDLNSHLQAKGNFDSFYPLLANSNNIGLYSYEYEIMLTKELVFSDATGLANAFVKDGKFNFFAFEQALDDETVIKAIAMIASEHLLIDDLSLQPDTKAALLAAYKLGQKS